MTCLVVTVRRPGRLFIGTRRTCLAVARTGSVRPIVVAGLRLWLVMEVIRQRSGATALLFALLALDLMLWGPIERWTHSRDPPIQSGKYRKL